MAELVTKQAYEFELTNTLVDLADNGILDNSCGTDIFKDKWGAYIVIYMFDPDKHTIPASYNGVRLRKRRPPEIPSQLGSPKHIEGSAEARIKEEARRVSPPSYNYRGPRIREMG